jgi:intraflagellar transport protein 80
MVALLDKNHELHISLVFRTDFRKIGTMVESMTWNDECDMLSCIADGKFMVWYYPNAIFIDEDVAALTRFEKDGRYV